MKKQLSALVFLVLISLSCSSPPKTLYHQEILAQVSDIIRTEERSGGPVIALFDLDDTVYDNRHRTLAILKEYASLPATRAEFPQSAQKINEAKLEQIHYDYLGSLKEVGATESKLHDQAKKFWRDRYFASAYCLLDQQMPGAVEYVKSLHKLGAHIVYLTGRDEPNMKKGTVESMKKLGFPLGERTTLILKPNFEMDDLVYKKGAFEKIHKIGRVVASFENEPRNLNAMGEAFPRSVLVFVDSQHSSAPDVPTKEAHWVKNFLPNAP